MWADDLAATFDRLTYSGNSRRRFLMNGRPEVNRGARGFTGGLQLLRGFCYTLLESV
jgi:hypothetical protein